MSRWRDTANKADASIRKVGFDVTLIRPAVEATGSPWDPVPRAEERFSGKGLILSNAFRFVDGSPVRTGDLKLMLSPKIDTVPAAGDLLEVKGTRYTVLDVAPLQPGGEVLYYELLLKR
jgi:hypothetical protein